jgi:arylsulfatase A-like enzyme/Tfp pilus assembly protein PilF
MFFYMFNHERAIWVRVLFWPALIILYFLCPLSGWAAPPADSRPAESPGSRLNVLLITIDTLRADRVSFYCSRYLQTPHLDSLASRSVVFKRAFSLTTTTLPSHTNILLGTTPSAHGVHDNANYIVRGEFLTLAEYLRSRGYATGAFVGGYPLISYFGLDQGFSVYDDSFGKQETGLQEAYAKGGERRAAAVWESAQKWLRQQKPPWFLWVHFYDPHSPYAPPEPYRTRFARNPYDGEVAYTDAVTGNLLDYLKDKGLLEKTVIILTGDHGESLGEHGELTHGYLAYNTTIWIPLLIYAPGVAHRVVDQNVSHIDIFPTICDLLNIDKPDFLQGASLLPLLRGKKAEERPIYFESLGPYLSMGWAPVQGLISGQSKFIDSPQPEFYDLDRDFDEATNLARSADINALRAQLARLIKSQTSAESMKAEKAADRATLEKLRSLGYVAGPPGPRKTAFGPQDSVAALLPYHNKAVEALNVYRSGKVGQATEALREVLTARKNIRAAYLNLAFIYKDQNRPADGIAVLRLGLEAMPENYDIYFQYIADLYAAGEFDEVIQAFQPRAYAQIDLDPVIWNYTGLAYWKKGNFPRAMASLEKSLDIDQDFAVTHFNLGILHFDVFRKTGRAESYNLALACFQKAVKLDPAYSAAHYSLGVAYYQTGRLGQAMASLEKALALDPGLDEAHYFLGSAYLQNGERSKAYVQLMKYKETPAYDSLSPAAKEKLEETIAKCRPEK